MKKILYADMFPEYMDYGQTGYWFTEQPNPNPPPIGYKRLVITVEDWPVMPMEIVEVKANVQVVRLSEEVKSV